MRLSIRHKLFLTLLFATTLVVGVMYGFMHWSFQHGFVSFLENRQQAHVERLVEQLAEIYAEEGGFDSLRWDRARWLGLQLNGRGLVGDRFPMGQGQGHRQGGRMGPGARSAEMSLVLLDADKRLIVGRDLDQERLILTPVQVAGHAVGYVGRLPGRTLKEVVDVRFVEAQRRSFLLIALLVAVLATALSWPLANTLVRPLRRITDGAKSLAKGRFGTRVPEQGNDELGDLARDFNHLAQTLERTEAARRQWMADISHELRTPLSILRAELEALQDGVRTLEPAAVTSLMSDVERLNRLVEDLYQLSMTDLGAMSYQKRDVDPTALLKDDVDALAGEFQRQGLQLQFRDDLPSPAKLQGDPDRLSQLFRNLLQNSLRYTDTGGRLEIVIKRTGAYWAADFQDSEPGVPADALAQLFERFYRVEASRSRAHGGAGLGLAICRNIVEAHGGHIGAKASPLGGLWIHLELPLLP